jgi:hypothetical protein
MNLGMRFGNIRTFVSLNTRENNDYNGLQAGVTTFDTNDDGEETYATTYFEVGGRADHLYDLLSGPAGFEPEVRLVSDVGTDNPYVGRPVVSKKKESVTPELKVA